MDDYLLAPWAIALGIDLAAAVILRSLRRSNNEALDAIKEAIDISDNKSTASYLDKADRGSLNVIMTGRLKQSPAAAQGNQTLGQYNAIAWRTEVIEHGVHRSPDGVNRHENHKLSSQTSVPSYSLISRDIAGSFAFLNSEEIIELPSPEGIPGFNSLYETVMDRYIPRSQRESELTSKYYVEGIRFLEEVVFVGTPVTVCGRLYRQAGRLVLDKPLSMSGGHYLISASTKDEVMNDLAETSYLAGIGYKISLVIAGALICGLVYHGVQRYKQNRDEDSETDNKRV